MAIPLSLQENSILKKRIIALILCAGEGTRIKDYAENIPKPLIKVKSENDRTILETILYHLGKQEIERIIIIVGHLRKNIEEFIDIIKKKDVFLSKDIATLYAELYKLGPLFSFLTITEDDSIYLKNKLYLILPGDTLFKLELLNKIISEIETVLNETPNPIIVFYREIKVNILKQKNPLLTTISIAQINKSSSKKLLNQIIQKKLNQLSEEETVKQIIPIFLINYDYTEKISKYQILDTVSTIRGIINYSIADGATIYAIQIPSELEFYDIDSISDLVYYEGLRKKEQ